MEITIKAKQFVFLLPNNPHKKGTPMKGFKKASIASVTAIAVAAGMCTPAFAEETATPVGVKVKDNVCTIVLNKDDATLLGLKAQQEIKKDDAKTAKKELIKAFTKRETIIKGLDQQLKDKKVTEQKVKEEQDKFKKESVAYSSVAAAFPRLTTISPASSPRWRASRTRSASALSPVAPCSSASLSSSLCSRRSSPCSPQRSLQCSPKR